MLCPRCGAYSPHNTSVCNRCGAKLTGDNSGELPRSRKYYRNARKSDLETALEQLQAKANDALDRILADKTKRIILIFAAAAIAVGLIAGGVSCVSCACNSCADGGTGAPAGSDTTAQEPGNETVSGADVTSGADAVSGGDITSASDAVSASDAQPPASPSDLPGNGEDEEDAEPADDALVSIEEYIPSLYIDLKYASTDNFTGKVIYDFTQPRLRYGTVKKLAAVQEELVSMGYSLVIWDAYRPLYAQRALWEACPDPAYVSDPTTGYRGHSRGHTVDITLTIIANGKDVVMPTGFDDFTSMADRDYSDVSPEAAANAAMLEEIMTRHGFSGYSGEWWHYSDTTEYPLIEGED